MTMQTKVCVLCKKEMPATAIHFKKDRRSMFGVSSFCIECEKKPYKEKLVAKNHELKRKGRDYYKQHKQMKAAYYFEDESSIVTYCKKLLCEHNLQKNDLLVTMDALISILEEKQENFWLISDYSQLEKICTQQSAAYPGFVYLGIGVEGTYEGKYKVGYSSSPEERIKQFKMTSDSSYNSGFNTYTHLLNKIYTNNMRQMEDYILEKYRPYLYSAKERPSKEWFDLPPKQVKWFNYMAEQSARIHEYV